MRLDERRKVIEVLLCAASSRVMSVYGAAGGLGHSLTVGARAMKARRAAADRMQCDIAYYYAQSATAAAYRLIETSPALRREWFGAR